MRRSVSILMVLLWWLAPLSALLPGSADAQLPTCCRRNGAHHCAMGTSAMALARENAAEHGVTAPAHCPLYHYNLPATSGVFALLNPEHRTENVEARISILARTPAEFERSIRHAGRGPPGAA